MAAIPLGSALDEDGERHSHWLMATVASRNQAYEFDTLRVLAWNVNRHRYDITHQQKDLVGYYPIELEPVPGAPANALAGFSLLVQTGELERERRHYAFPKSSTRPKMMSAETITLAKPEPARREDYVAPLPLAPPAPAEPPYWQRVRTRWKRAWS